MARIARCNWLGKKFYAELLEERPGGSMFMRALQKGDRFVPGSHILVQPGEVMEWVSELPPDIAARSDTPDVAPEPPDSPPDSQGGDVRPTQPPETGADKEPRMSSFSKAKALGEMARDFHAQLGKDIDGVMGEYAKLAKKKDEALGVHRMHMEGVAADLDEAKAAVTELSNFPLASGT